MYRFLLTPRWWGINLFVVLAIPVCLFMGSWQLGRFEARVEHHRQQEKAAENTVDETPVPLAELLPLDRETVGRTGEVEGRYDADRTFLVPERRIEGKRGFYVLSLLRTDTGPAVPVVRGWLPGDADRSRVPEPPTGEVTVRGLVQVSESERSPGVHVSGGLPPGQLALVSAASLVNVVPYDVEDAWLSVQDPQPPLRPVPPAAVVGTGLDMDAFQNLGYTAEWFAFAGFAVFMWYRLFRREAEMARDAELGLPPEDDPEEGPTRGPAEAPTHGPADEAADDAAHEDAPAPEPGAARPDGTAEPEPDVSPGSESAPGDDAGRTRSPSGAA